MMPYEQRKWTDMSLAEAEGHAMQPIRKSTPSEHDPDMVEAVAIAICNADWPDASDPWNTQWNDRGRQRYRRCAVAALDALEQGSYENWDGTIKPFRTARWRQ